MKLVPFENITYATKLSIKEVLQKLDEHIEKPNSSLFSRYTKSYIGQLTDNIFEIHRNINYRNSFLPQIKGKVYSGYDGTKIEVSMKPHIFIIIFMSVWLGATFLGGLTMSYASIIEKNFSIISLAPFSMFFLGAALFIGAFKFESEKSKKDFIKMFDAEITNH